MSSSMFSAAVLALSLVSGATAQVTATGTMGVSNPPRPTLGPYNQTSDARLLSLNSIDDFCIFAPATPGDTIGDQEGEVVAYCTKPRNNARLIPDGTITAAHLVRTPNYIQVQGFGDLTKLNIQANDFGGELDPHGATGLGNPVGGNVTSNVTGTDVSYEEWMNYVAFDSFCLRICTSQNSTYSAAQMCQHELDLMGCEFVMPGDYSQTGFTSCEGDAAYPPGIYPIGAPGSGTTSTFAQRYTGTYTAAGTTAAFTIGVTVTPTAAYSIPASSNCVTVSTISNGVTGLAVATQAASSAAVASSAPATTGGAVSSRASGAAASSSRVSGSAAAARSSGASASASAATGAGSRTAGGFPLIGAGLSLAVALLGAGAVLL